MRAPRTVTRSCLDLGGTLLLWTYYIGGFFLFFAPLYLAALCVPARREVLFQTLNCWHYRIFFRLLRVVAPRVQWRIAEDVTAIRSAIIIANHLSFLDPLLFISLFQKQKTIVKGAYFGLPVFGFILRMSGYLASFKEMRDADAMMHQIRRLSDYLSDGGNLFVFPEGTRSRDGRLGSFDKGAFRLARLCGAPIRVVVLSGTDKLYPPDRFLFDTQAVCTIEARLAGSIEPVVNGEPVAVSDLMRQARALMEGGGRT